MTQIEIKKTPGNNDFTNKFYEAFWYQVKEVQVIEKKRLREKVYKKVVDLNL